MKKFIAISILALSVSVVSGCGSPTKQASIVQIPLTPLPVVPTPAPPTPAPPAAAPSYSVSIPATTTGTYSGAPETVNDPYTLVVPITITSVGGWSGEVAIGQQQASMPCAQPCTFIPPGTTGPTGSATINLPISAIPGATVPSNGSVTVDATVSYFGYPLGTYNFSVVTGIVGTDIGQTAYGKITISSTF